MEVYLQNAQLQTIAKYDKYVWEYMEVGQVMFLPNPTERVFKTASEAGKRLGRVFRVRTMPDGIRIWRGPDLPGRKPKGNGGKPGKPCKYPWYTMAVGTRHKVNNAPRSLTVSAHAMSHKLRRDFQVEFEDDGSAYIYRLT